ncbi:MAG: ABC transporter substrate-binding protein, partial [Microbacterium sp.]
MRKPGITAVAVLGATLLLLTGCTGRDTASPTESATVDPTALVAALPDATTEVDDVTWALVEGEPRSLIPGADYNFVAPNLCDSLLRVEPDFSIGEGIATTADWVDPVTFVIDLREGVTFWDGTPVTAADVIYSLERHRNDVTDSYYGAFVLVESIDATSDSQVTVRFTAPDSDFRNAIASGGGAVLSKMYSEEAGDALGTSGGGLLCAGPYELESWTPGTDIVTVANEDYWDGAPLVKTVTYKFISDGTTLTNALLEGEVDGAFNVPPASRNAFETSDGGRLVVGPSTASFSFGPTKSTGAGANPQIRQALSLAIDRNQYIQTVLNGLGQAQSTFVAPFS